jgi:hypothetical protein
MMRTLPWLALALLTGCHVHDLQIIQADGAAGPGAAPQGRDPAASFQIADSGTPSPPVDATMPAPEPDAAPSMMPPPAPGPDSAAPIAVAPDASAPVDTAPPPMMPPPPPMMPPPQMPPPVGALGAACASNDQCGSGVCAGGICCNVACDSPCLTCRTADRPGLCLPVREKEPCAPAGCELGIAHEVSVCDGRGRCMAGKLMVCKSLTCAPDGRCAPECRDARDPRCGGHQD